MSWDRDPLWAKSKLFFERAFEQDRDDPLFGFWCSLGLELLARAALSSKSPLLLAAPDTLHKHLLYALGEETDPNAARSIDTKRVYRICQTIFPTFTSEDLNACMGLLARRNDELHSGNSSFESYPPKIWLSGFYRACKSLVEILGETLEILFGSEEARIAEEILAEDRAKVKHQVQSAIAAHRKVFLDKSAEEQAKARAASAELAKKLAFQRHHKVECPACGSVATVQGEVFGQRRVRHLGDVIEVRQPVAPRSFHCSACDLKLIGYAQLEEADLGGHYTRKAEYFPDEFYDLIDPQNFDPFDHIDMDEIRRRMVAEEYDNE